LNKEIEFAKLMIKNRGKCFFGYSLTKKYEFGCTGCPYSEDLANNICTTSGAYQFFLDFLKQKESGQLEFKF